MTERKPMQKPTSLGSRQVQLDQLSKRYSTTFKKINETTDGTNVRLAIKPTDPDFPFDLDHLQLQLFVPTEYPAQPTRITVINTDIPKGFAINLERGFEEYVKTVKTTLVRQMSWLDRNMEQLLQQQPAKTVRFVSHSTKSTVAPALPDHIVQQQTATSSSSSSSSSFASSSASSASSSHIMVSHVAATPPSTHIEKKKVSQCTSTLPSKNYTDGELAAAFARRSREIDQLKSRLGAQLRTSKSDRTLFFISFTLNDPDFTHGALFDDGVLRIRYHVPLQYPLLPCYLDIDNKNAGKLVSSTIVQAFTYHSKTNTDFTLFEHLNWLNRHMEDILNHPPTSTTDFTTDNSDLDTITPILRPIRSQLPNVDRRPQRQPKQSIFVDDQAKNKVIVVDDASLVRPPPGLLGADHQRKSGVEHLSHSDNTAATASATSTADGQGHNDEQQQQQPASSSLSSSSSGSALEVSPSQGLRRGTEIRLIQPQLENVLLFRCISLHVLVKCSRCKNTVDLENVHPESASNDGKAPSHKQERWTSCSTCHSVVGIRFLSELVHDNASSLGLLQLAGCTAFDLLGSHFLFACASCMADIPSSVRLAPHDRPIAQSCFHCHSKMKVALSDYRFVNIGQGGERLVADESQVMKLKKKRRTKEDVLTVGEPLPNEGTCSHYQKSKRWFRFPCCGKLYACDVCHDKQQDHPYEMAIRHVCGLCSKEQSAVGNKPCARCGHEFEKTTNKAFWEGGQGIRDRSLMNRNDPHKHKGVSKVGSKKQERTGLAGKQKREKAKE